jgi:hypothetical protein
LSDRSLVATSFPESTYVSGGRVSAATSTPVFVVIVPKYSVKVENASLGPGGPLRRPLRRRLQPLRHLAGRGGPQARRPAPACDNLGRDDATIAKTVLYVGRSLASDDLDGFISEMADYARVGIQQVIVMPTGDQPDVWIEQVCTPLASRLAELD